MHKRNEILENELVEAFANVSDNIYVYICDMQSDLSRWSRNAVQHFDMEGEYIRGAGDKWMEKIHPEDQARYKEIMDAIFSGNSKSFDQQYRVRNKYGDYVWMEGKGSVICDEEGKPVIFAGMMTRLDNQNKYDPLTHLMTGFEMQHYRFSTSSGAIMLLGINDFRKINNISGYLYGNKVLRAFAQSLQKLKKSTDSLYRLQGDEFIIISPGGTREEMQELFNRIVGCCGNMRLAEDGIKSFSVSAGIVAYPDDGKEYDVLLTNLEHSLQYAKDQKAEKRELAVAFSQKIADIHIRSGRLKEALTRSIKNNFEGFELYFQPILDRKAKHVVACEALLRWRTPEIQDATPYEFIKLLEESGEIREVGLWVMEDALRHAAKWQKKYGDITVSFNVSYLQLTDEEFVDRLLEKAEEYQVDPGKVVVELTESCNAEDKETLSIYFDRLRESGFKIAMDDFGTEYASFGLLHDVSMDLLKIDQKFVRGLVQQKNVADVAIIESVVDMCEKLAIQTVAEGIETEEIQEVIRKIGVTFLQGYLYSRPVPEAEFEKIVEQRR